MARVSIAFIRKRLSILNMELKIDLEIERGYGGYRIVAGNGSIDVSSRMKLAELEAWVDGFWVATFRSIK